MQMGGKMTQNEAVLMHLKNGGSITTLQAIEEYGITRLSARIHDLRAKGYRIGSKIETVTNRYGKSVSVSKYYLLKGEENGKHDMGSDYTRTGERVS